MGNMLNRSQKVRGKIFETFGQRRKQRAVLAAIARIEIGYRIVDRTLEQNGCAIIQRMCTGSRRYYPRYLDRKRTKEGARDPKWKSRGPEIVAIALESDLSRRARAADLAVSFDDRR